MSNPKREIEAAFGQRVYEYRDDQGVVYYSFTRAVSIISPPTRLKLESRIGVHLIRFLAELRRKGDLLVKSDGVDG